MYLLRTSVSGRASLVSLLCKCLAACRPSAADCKAPLLLSLLPIPVNSAQAGSGGTTQVVLLTTAGQSFKTVSAALRSNTCAQCNIHLVLQRSPAAS